MMSKEYSKVKKRSSTSRNMKPLEVWTCQRAENLKKKSSKIPKNNYAATIVSAARRQIIGGGGGGAPINKSRRRRRSQIVGSGGAARRGWRTALPRTRLAIMQRRAFSVVGPSAWNDLPVELRSLLMTSPSNFYI